MIGDADCHSSSVSSDISMHYTGLEGPREGWLVRFVQDKDKEGANGEARQSPPAEEYLEERAEGWIADR